MKSMATENFPDSQSKLKPINGKETIIKGFADINIELEMRVAE